MNKLANGRAHDLGPHDLGPNEKFDAELVSLRLEEAGATLLSLPSGGARTELRTSAWPAIHAEAEAYGWSGARLKPASPAAQAISRMDEALGWIRLIPQENYVLRRIVGARALVSPLTGRHLFSWRRLGGLLGADGRAIQRWHGKGIAMIVAALNGEAEAPAPGQGPGQAGAQGPGQAPGQAPTRRALGTKEELFV